MLLIQGFCSHWSNLLLLMIKEYLYCNECVLVTFFYFTGGFFLFVILELEKKTLNSIELHSFYLIFILLLCMKNSHWMHSPNTQLGIIPTSHLCSLVIRSSKKTSFNIHSIIQNSFIRSIGRSFGHRLADGEFYRTSLLFLQNCKILITALSITISV